MKSTALFRQASDRFRGNFAQIALAASRYWPRWQRTTNRETALVFYR
jgi:hypothetical protein